MPIKFKNSPKPQGGGPKKSIDDLRQVVRTQLGLAGDTAVEIGITETSLYRNGISLKLPFGLSAVSINPSSLSHVRKELEQTFVHLKGTPTEWDGPALPLDPLAIPESAIKPATEPAPITNVSVGTPKLYSDMTDEKWIEHTAKELFPGKIHLHEANELYQSVFGTSGGSVYKTCFIGPTLKVACRIKSETLSLRVTTHENQAPEGELLKVFERLGIVKNYKNRITAHAQMSGPYNGENAAEYRAMFGAYYAALKPWITTNFPAIGELAKGVK